MDIPVLAMIERSGWVARIILLLLVALSVVTWAIIFNRLAGLGGIRKLHRLFRKNYESLDKLTDSEQIEPRLAKTPLGRLSRVAATEYKRVLGDAHADSGVKDWSFFFQNQFAMVGDRMDAEIEAQVSELDKGIFFLALSSSLAPFLGLWGTVWGIMNSFFQIGNQGSASLPVVAPGIAEALIATILGLGVAIPAVFFYNYFVHQVERIEGELDEMRDLFLVRIRREIFSLLYGGNNRRGPAA